MKGWTWFSHLVVNWMEADVNASLQSIVRKGRRLGGQNYWRNIGENLHMAP